MKMNEKVMRILLIVLVLSSLYFSANIWLSSFKTTQLSTETAPITSTVVNEREAADSFLPLRVIRVNDTQKDLSHNENYIAALQQLISESTFGDLSQLVYGDEQQFSTYLTELSEGFQLAYEGSLLLSDYINIYQLALTQEEIDENVYFSAVQLDLTQRVIRFINFDKKQIFEAPIEFKTKQAESLLVAENVPFQALRADQSLADRQYYSAGEVELKKYSYILAAQPVAKFRNAFFQDTEAIRTNEDSEDFTYTSKNEQLRVDDELGIIIFNGQFSAPKTQPTIYHESFAYVKALGTNMGNIRYFDCFKSEVRYRTFVEGYPVFSENDQGQVRVTIEHPQVKEPTITIYTSVNMIQVPIPSDETVLLKDTQTLKQTLIDAGVDEEKIHSMVIGYTWCSLTETKQIVDLTPEWYILYDQTWLSEEALLQQARQEAN